MGLGLGRSLLAGFLSIEFLLGVLPWWAHSSHYHHQQQHGENSEEDPSPGYVFTVAWDSLRARRLNGEGTEREPEFSACNSLSRQSGTSQKFVPPPCLFLCCSSSETLQLFSWLSWLLIWLNFRHKYVPSSKEKGTGICSEQSRCYGERSTSFGRPVGRASLSMWCSC